MKVYIGRWDCDYCGNMGNLGPHTHCSSCGSARPNDVVFYMPRGVDAEVTDDAELAAAKEGANWVCDFCNNSNRNSYTACVSCGALKEASKKNLQVREFSEREVPTSSKPQQKLAANTKPPKRSSNFFKIIVFLGILGFGYFGLSQFSSSIEVEVTNLEWQRNIEVEEYKLVTEEDWDLPKGAQVLKTSKDIHHYDRRVTGYQTRSRTVQEAVGTEQYVCGKRDLGNGYFEDKYCTRTIYRDKQEEYEEPVYQEFPVYKTKYEYTIYRWKLYKTYKTDGTNKAPKWAVLPDFVQTEKKKYRIQEKKETYRFAIKDHRTEKHWYEADYDYWEEQIFIGKTLKAEKSMLFGYFKQLKDLTKVRPIDR